MLYKLFHVFFVLFPLVLPFALNAAVVYVTPCGNLLKKPGEFTIMIQAKTTNHSLQGNLVNHLGSRECGYSIRAKAIENGAEINFKGLPFAAMKVTFTNPNALQTLTFVVEEKSKKAAIYVNGQNAGKGWNSSLATRTWRPYVFGDEQGGDITGVAMWNRALDAEEVQNPDLKTADYAWDMTSGIKILAGNVPIQEQKIPKVIGVTSGPSDTTTTWYNRVPEEWTDMIPIGNGYMGGMIAGHPEHEFIILNDGTL